MSIRNKIILTILIIVIVPILCLNELFFFKTKQEMKKGQFSKLEVIADLKMERIEGYFKARQADMVIAQQYWNIKTNLPILIKMSDDPDSPSYLTAEKNLDSQLNTFQETHKYLDVMLVNPAGLVVYCSNKNHAIDEVGSPLLDPSGKLFEQARNRIAFSEVFHDSRAGHGFQMYIAGPAYNDDKKFIGVIVFELNMQPIYSFIQDITGMGTTGETLIGKKVDDQVLFLNNLRHDPGAALKRKVLIGGKDALSMQKAVETESGSGISVDYRGKTTIAAWRYIPVMQWGLVAKIDTSEAFAAISTFRRITTTVLILTLLLVTLLILAFAHSIGKPLRSLQNGSKRLGDGELDFRFKLKVGGELGQLAKSFNLMAEKLSESYATLEGKVDGRTQELEESRSAALSAMQDANTQRQQAEETLVKLEESNQKLQVEVEERVKTEEELDNLFNLAAEGLVYIDMEHTVLKANKTFLAQFQTTNEKILGQKCYDFFDEGICWKKSKGNDYCTLYQIKNNIQTKEEEVNVNQGGEKKFFIESGSALKAADGSLVGLLKSYRDISDRKKAEKELHKKMAELERFSKMASGREQQMIKLKKEINDLRKQLGQDAKYRVIN